MTLLDRSAGVALGIAVMVGLVWGSHVPTTVNRSDDAVLRLAWSALPERIEECRQRSEEELAALPAHMRQPLACEGTSALYRLQVRIDGVLIADRMIHGGGLRRDRRIYVFEERAVPPHAATIDVRFDRVDSGESGTTVETLEHEPQRNAAATLPARQREHIPPHLSLERRVNFSSRRVMLVTYSLDRRALVAVE